jgi:hypothetical protein
MDSKVYVPADPVVSVLERFVCRLVIVTVAPDTAAPEGSVIVPRIVDVPSCPQTQVLDRKKTISRTRKLSFIVGDFIDRSFRANSSN